MAWGDDMPRTRFGGNPPPGSDPTPFVPGDNTGTENPMSEGGWPNVGYDGEFAVPGNPAPMSDPRGPVSSDPHPFNQGNWPDNSNEELSPQHEFAVPGNPQPGSEPIPGGTEGTPASGAGGGNGPMGDRYR